MNKRQTETLELLAARLKKPHLGASIGGPTATKEVNAAIELLQSHGFEVTSRCYLNSWIIPPLNLVTSKDGVSQELARRLAS